MYYFQFFILQRLVFDTSGLCLLSLSIQCKVTHIHTFAQPCFSKILSRSIVFFPKVKNQRSLILHCHDFVLHDISSFSFMYKSWTLTFQKYLEHYRVSFENLILFNFQDLATLFCCLIWVYHQTEKLYHNEDMKSKMKERPRRQSILLWVGGYTEQRNWACEIIATRLLKVQYPQK